MDFEVVMQKLTEALNEVLQRDNHLLRYNLSERAIAHRLAFYLTPSFPDFDVDCEYNGNVDADNGRKYISILKQHAQELGLLKNDELDQELIDCCVYPDIIVHKRGKNGSENNLLIIEIKKSSSKVKGDWDAEKLKRFTSRQYQNNFVYQFGAFVLFRVGNNPDYRVEWYRDGQKL
jgi:hypothetical protein